MVIVMYDLDGKEIEIIDSDEVEFNRIDDIFNTMDLTNELEEVRENE